MTRDIQQVAEKSFGANLDWFFDQWIRGVGVPQYRMLYDQRQTEDGSWLIEGTIQQRVVVGSERSFDVLEGTYYRGVVNLIVTAGGEAALASSYRALHDMADGLGLESQS